MKLNIIARKPKDNENEYIVVDKGAGFMWGRYVSATTNAHTLAHNQWFWGHYFDTRDEVMKYFNSL
jgi:hypothetical protein